MDAPTVIYALRWLIHDTFRQTLTSRVFWLLLALSATVIIFCLGVSVDGGAVREGNEFYHPVTNKLLGPGEAAGHVSLFFGVFRYAFTREAEPEVAFLLSVFASWIAGFFGMLMALVWTAGFVPESLQPSAAAVLLAKPVPRWLFLLGKYLGVVCFIALHVTIFFVGTWFALGLRTGYLPAGYLLAILPMIFHFATIFSFSVMLAVLFRSSTACIVGSVLFWLGCYAINYGRHFAVVYGDIHPNGPPLSAFTVFLSEAGYWILPKPADFTILIEKGLQLQSSHATLETQEPFRTVLSKNLFHPLAIILTSCLFPIFALWSAASQLAKTDY
jgi:ABC-type transport system involved in multi-copper enzyme maturation permease subunit